MSNETQELKVVVTKDAKKKKSYIQRAFFKGVAGILPALLTLVILVWFYQALRDYMGVYVNTIIEWTVRVLNLEKVALGFNRFLADHISVYLAPAEAYVLEKVNGVVTYIPATELKLRPLVGIILSLILIYMLGSFISSFVGRKLFPRFERMFLRIPVVKAVYPYARQVTDFFLGEQTIKFERIVAVEYPRRGMWSVAFVTNEGLREVCDKTGKRMLIVFVPASPTPVTGYAVMVPVEDVIPLDMSVDAALRLVITGGVSISPDLLNQRGGEPKILEGKVPPQDPGTPPAAK